MCIESEKEFFFYRGHPVVLLLTVNKIYLLASDITYNLVYYNIYGRLVSVNKDHLQALYIKLRANCLWYIKMQMLMLKSIENFDMGSHLHC